MWQEHNNTDFFRSIVCSKCEKVSISHESDKVGVVEEVECRNHTGEK
jgi:hypothetical protein